MSGNTANPRVWLNGSVFAGAVGSTAPTDISTALNAAFKDLGLLSEDGTEEVHENDQAEFYARGGILVRSVLSKDKVTIKVTCLEDNQFVFPLVNPGSTQSTTTGVTTRSVKVKTPNPMAFVIVDTDGGYTRRKAIAKGEVIEVGPQIAGPEMTMRELTIVIYPSAAGVLYTEITDDPAAAVS